MARVKSQRTIVVGLDNTPGARAALRWAVSRAVATGAVVRAVHALELPDAAESLESDVSGVRAAMQSRVHTWAAEVLAGLPFDVPVSVEVRDGDAARVLSRAARNAESLVVGTNAGSDHSPVAECVVPTLCEVVIVDENGHTEYLRGPYLRDDQTGRQVV